MAKKLGQITLTVSAKFPETIKAMEALGEALQALDDTLGKAGVSDEVTATWVRCAARLICDICCTITRRPAGATIRTRSS